jgi:hypothetical protein
VTNRFASPFPPPAHPAPVPSLPQQGKHRPPVGAKAVADLRQRPARLVQRYCLVDLFGEEAVAAHRHLVAAEDLADRPSVVGELLAELVDRGESWVGEALQATCGRERRRIPVSESEAANM